IVVVIVIVVIVMITASVTSLTLFFFHHLAFTVLSLASPVLFFLDVLVVTVSIETNYSYHVYSFLFNPSISSFKSSILPFIFPTVASRLAIFSSLLLSTASTGFKSLTMFSQSSSMDLCFSTLLRMSLLFLMMALISLRIGSLSQDM